MLDIGFIRENKQQVIDDARDKGVGDLSSDIDGIIKLDDKRKTLQADFDSIQQKRNALAKEMSSGERDDAKVTEAKQLKTEIAEVEKDLSTTKEQIKNLMINVPNVMHPSVKRGEGESANEVVKTVSEKPTFDFEPKDHETLGLEKDLLDLEAAAHTSGSRFYYLKNEAVLLEYALVNWLLQKYVEKGFTPVTTPVLVREHMMYATGFFPADKNEIYKVNPGEDDLYLIGTSEVTLAGLHMKKPLSEDQLAKRYVGFSSCFRREAGSYGKDTKGIFRVHQFDKVEMYSYCHPDKSWEEHEFMLSIEEEILQELGLHYQVVNIGSGDLGAPAAKKYDCEVWIPSQERYRELTSCSNTTDFQTRRGNIKYRTNDGKLEYCHTLNGTAMASTRTILAIMETYQQADGSIKIPEVLQKYMNGKEVI